jgi:hypothetical protein
MRVAVVAATEKTGLQTTGEHLSSREGTHHVTLPMMHVSEDPPQNASTRRATSIIFAVAALVCIASASHLTRSPTLVSRALQATLPYHA